MIGDFEANVERSNPVEPGTEMPRPAKSNAFLRLFLQNDRRVYAYILTLLPNRADADDVLQEASLVMWDKFDENHPPDDFAAWGCRIAYYKVLEFRKRCRRGRVFFSQELLDRLAETAIEQADALQLDERQEALRDCIDKLPARDRDLLARRLAPDATTQSTAAEVGRSVDAVYKALSKIRQTLFDCVSRTVS